MLLFSSGHSAIKTRLVNCCSDGCLSATFSARVTIGLVWSPSLWRVVVVPKFFHLRIMEAIVLLGTHCWCRPISWHSSWLWEKPKQTHTKLHTEKAPDLNQGPSCFKVTVLHLQSYHKLSLMLEPVIPFEVLFCAVDTCLHTATNVYLWQTHCIAVSFLDCSGSDVVLFCCIVSLTYSANTDKLHFIDQWWATLVLEGHCLTKFRSIPNQDNCL